MANDYLKPESSIVQISSVFQLIKVSESGIHLPLHWIAGAGFTHGMPAKVRIMPDGIMITAQNLRELKECFEGVSLQDVLASTQLIWLQNYPGDLFLDVE